MYSIDPKNRDIVITGFENGIANSPYEGVSDMRSVNPISIPGEVSTSFSTSKVTTAPVYTNISVSADGTGNILVTGLTQGSLMEKGQAISFSASTITSATVGTIYWIAGASQQSSTSEIISITTTYGSASGISLGTSGTATLSVFAPDIQNYSQKSRGNNFMLDNRGRVWTDYVKTSGGTGGITSTNSWTYMGNTTDSSSNGNGLLLFTTVHNGTGGSTTQTTLDEWLFVWRNSQIDYVKITDGSSAIAAGSLSWVYAWNYKTAATGSTGSLNTLTTVPNPHQAIQAPNAQANFVDGNYLGNFYQNIPSPGSNYVGFDPTNIATYTPQTITALIAANDVGQCLAFVNDSTIVGGRYNIIYPWNNSPASNTFTPPLIQLPEQNIAAIVTVANNAYVFAGNRGNIYITNGSQADFYKKVPDHISNSIEPLFQWGAGTAVTIQISPHCATYSKRRLYFGISASLQAGGNATTYGGIWCIDIDKGIIFNSQQMSYGTYLGYVSCIGTTSSNSAGGVSYGPNIGYGLIAGWSDGGTPTYGIDADIALPYSATNQSWVTSDMVPIGTAINPTTSGQIEFKLATPLVSGESVKIDVGSYLDTTYASFTTAGTLSYSTVSTANNLSAIYRNPKEKQQWNIVRATLVSTGTSPSYCRIKEIRIKGAIQ